MKTRIIITGGAGFLGSYLALVLKNEGYMVNNSFDILFGNNIFSEMLDYNIHQSDVVIHLAALTSVKDSFNNPTEYYKNNVLGTARVIAKCLAYDRKLIYISSAAVKDYESSPYATSKYFAEEITKLFLEKENMIILRPENVYGKGMKKGTLLYNYLHDKELIVDGDGKQIRDYIHINDVVGIILKAIENDWKGKVVLVGTGKGYSVNEIAKFVNKLTGKTIVNRPENTTGTKKSVADISTLRELYKDSFKYDLFDWIKEELK